MVRRPLPENEEVADRRWGRANHQRAPERSALPEPDHHRPRDPAGTGSKVSGLSAALRRAATADHRASRHAGRGLSALAPPPV